MVEGLKTTLENKNSDIEKIVKESFHSVKTALAPRPTYSSVATKSVAATNVAANKKTINKNKIIINAENIDEFDKQLKQKICPQKVKVNVTFYLKN